MSASSKDKKVTPPGGAKEAKPPGGKGDGVSADKKAKAEADAKAEEEALAEMEAEEEAEKKAKADAKAEEDAKAQAEADKKAKAEADVEAEADAKLYHVAPKASILCGKGVVCSGKPICPRDIHADPKVAQANFDALVEKGLIEKPKKK